MIKKMVLEIAPFFYKKTVFLKTNSVRFYRKQVLDVQIELTL